MQNRNTRTKNSAINIIVSFINQFSNQIMGFIVRTVFIKVLSVEYLGINGLFTNILTVLSLAELGVGSAIVYSMYKPMADNDITQMQMYMSLYKKIYCVIGSVVLVFGFLLTPFLNLFIAENPNIKNINLIYILYVLKTASTYYFSYKQSIFLADQKTYIITNNTMLFTFIRSVLEIIILLITRSFISYLTFSVICNFAQNLYIAHKADKMYPYIKEKLHGKVPKEVIIKLKKNIGAMFLHKVGSVVLNSTDAIIISKFIGILAVGLYSNYSMIIIIVRNAINEIFDGIVPSVGNLCAENSTKIYHVYNSIYLLNMWIVGFCSICLYILLNPFISIWIGSKYLIQNSAVLAMVISFYLQVNMRSIEMFRSATGLFYYDRYVPLIQCIINLFISITLAKSLGIVGIFIGTSIAMLCTCFWVQPVLVFKHIFNQPIYKYFEFYMQFTVVTVVALCLTKLAIMIYDDMSIIGLLYKMFCCIVIPNAFYLLISYNKPEFIFLINKLKPLLHKVVNR